MRINLLKHYNNIIDNHVNTPSLEKSRNARYCASSTSVLIFKACSFYNKKVVFPFCNQ